MSAWHHAMQQAALHAQLSKVSLSLLLFSVRNPHANAQHVALFIYDVARFPAYPCVPTCVVVYRSHALIFMSHFYRTRARLSGGSGQYGRLWIGSLAYRRATQKCASVCFAPRLYVVAIRCPGVLTSACPRTTLILTLIGGSLLGVMGTHGARLSLCPSALKKFNLCTSKTQASNL